MNDAGINRVESRDLEVFFNLVHVDCSGNELQDMGAFHTLPKLELLELPLNRISSLTIPTGTFQTLTLLDLSYNRLTPDSLWELGTLPKLQSLDLSGNDLTELRTLAGPGAFVSLRELVLDKNKLSGTSPFSALCGLPSLVFLSMNHNRVKFIPFIAARGDSPDDGMPRPDEGGPPATPFPELQVLSLTHNRIVDPADLLNAACFERLESLHIWNNPIVNKTVAVPLVLRVELCERRGIELLRRSPTSSKPSVHLDPDRVVTITEVKLPTIKLGGALAALEAVARTPPQYITFDTAHEPATARPLPPISPQDDPGSGSPGVFLTQLGDGDGDDGDGAAAAAAAASPLQFDPDDERPLTAAELRSYPHSAGTTRGGSAASYGKPSRMSSAGHIDVGARGASARSRVSQDLSEADSGLDEEYRIHTPLNPYLPRTPSESAKSRGLPEPVATPPLVERTGVHGDTRVLRGGDPPSYFSEEHALLELQRMGFPMRPNNMGGPAIEPERPPTVGEQHFRNTVSRGMTGESKVSLSDFDELFREDDPTEEGVAEAPLPRGIAASVKALKYTLDHPLVLSKRPQSAQLLAIEGPERSWQQSNIDDLLNSITL